MNTYTLSFKVYKRYNSGDAIFLGIPDFNLSISQYH